MTATSHTAALAANANPRVESKEDTAVNATVTPLPTLTDLRASGRTLAALEDQDDTEHAATSDTDRTAIPSSARTEPTTDRARRKAASLAGGDMITAARMLFTAAETYRRQAGNPDMADRVTQVRADLMAVIAGVDTPSEIKYGDLAADASAYADELETLREELESVHGPHVYGKGN